MSMAPPVTPPANYQLQALLPAAGTSRDAPERGREVTGLVCGPGLPLSATNGPPPSVNGLTEPQTSPRLELAAD